MIKKALGFIAAAMTFTMVNTAHAVGSAGDIRSIVPSNAKGEALTAAEQQKYIAGSKAYFLVRLLNLNYEESEVLAVSQGKTWGNPWTFKLADLSLDASLAWYMYRPAFGVVVSGSLRSAQVVDGWPRLASNPMYTDILCSYTVEPGDMALPMLLAGQNGKAYEAGSTSAYCLQNVNYGLSAFVLSATEKDASDINADPGTWGNKNTYSANLWLDDSNIGSAPASEYATLDATLAKAGINVQTVSFAKDGFTAPQGQSDKVVVNIEGGVNTNGSATVWALTKDLDAFELGGNNVETVTVSDGNVMDGTYQMAPVTIPVNVDNFSFTVKGIETGETGTVYLATSKGFAYDPAGTLVTNFITATVACVKPPPAYIEVTLDGAASKTVTSGPDSQLSVAKMTIRLSEPYAGEMSVNIVSSMGSGSATAPVGKYISISSFADNGFDGADTTVTFAANQQEVSRYVYVRGADTDTEKGIKFSAVATGAGALVFKNENIPATLYVKRSTPVIRSPVEGHEVSGLNGGVNVPFTIKVADDYNNMNDEFTIEWYKTGSGSPSYTKQATPNVDGEITITAKYNAGDYNTRFRVKNAAGVWSDYRTIKVQANPAKRVSAVIEDVEGSTFGEDIEEISVKFQLSEPFESDDYERIYAFLVPQDTASSNLVQCKQFKTGVALGSGDTVSQGVAKMTILDGNDDTLPLVYSIELRTAREYGEGEVIAVYESKDLELYVNNLAPRVSGVYMSGAGWLRESGKAFTGKASKNLNKVFTFEAADVEADLANITAEWSFEFPNGYAPDPVQVTGVAGEIALTNAFSVVGKYKGMLRLRDKDMGKNKWSETFVFEFEVLDTPSVGFEFPNSNTFNELDADKGESYFYVTLSTPATDDLGVKLDVVREGNTGVMQLAADAVTFRAGSTREQVNITYLDGTPNAASFRGGFAVTASVTNETVNTDGMAWNKVYIPYTQKIYVSNDAPTIDQPSIYMEGMTNNVSMDVTIPLPWVVSDVEFDLTNNLTVTWSTSEGVNQTFTGDNVHTGVWSVVFTSGGPKQVTITVTDKDGTPASRTLNYYVAPAKAVNAYPQGPYSGGALSSVSKLYLDAAGLGAGRIWSDAGKETVVDFAHRLTYDVTKSTANIYAWGYSNGAVDNGNLVAGRDIAIDADGNSGATGNYYTYTGAGNRDSFFYAWVINAKGEEGGSTYTGTVNLSPKSGNSATIYPLSLPTEMAEDSSSPYYIDSYIDAFFSMELFAEDNLGDMNADGVPDIFATKSWSLTSGEVKTIPELKTGKAIAGSEGGEGGEGETASASDLADIADYVPEAAAAEEEGSVVMDAWSWRAWNGSHKVPSWGAKVKFTAYDKIRGFGDGMNYKPGTVSDWNLAENEKLALIADYVAAGNALAPAMVDKVDELGNKVQKVDDEGNPVVDGEGNPVYEQVAQDVVDATLTGGAYAWAIANNWTCEPQMLDAVSGAKNLNPAVLDTDADGYADAWEHFFWYYAKAGAVIGGKWVRMTGSRFSLAKLGSGEVIPSEQIEEAFHPGIRRVQDSADYDFFDFDGDGLSDLEEYVLGTSPVHWDSDGDGISDFYEVISGTDPLSDNDGDRLLGAASFGNNPDRDFMAWSDYYNWQVVTFENGQKFASPAQSEIMLASALGEGETPAQYAIAVVDDGTKAGVAYYVDKSAADYVYTADKVVRLAKAVEAWKRIQWPEIINPGEAPAYWLSGKAVTLPAGTVLKKAIDADALESASPAVVNNWKVWSAEYGEMVSTNMTLRLFVYGAEDAVGPSGQKGVLVAAGKSLDSTSAYPTVKDKNKGKVVSIESGKTVSLIHNQVFTQDGFDPRVAWCKNLQGAVSDRWSSLDTVNKGDMAGAATNTVPYSTLDEYLVMQYRYEALKLGIADEIIAGGAEERCNLAADQSDLDSGARSLYDIIRKNTTVAADKLEFVYTNSNGVVTEYKVRGADSDEDGIPDGWELYVKADPNWAADASLTDLSIFDKDSLNLLTEYSGNDSCAAYSNRYDSVGELVYEGVESIVKNGPWEKNSSIYGWYNKFFPTNPNAEDTDEDGIADGDEGGKRNGKFYIGRNQYEAPLTFIFGTEDIVDDGTSKCIRGGGLNPCTVDTDMDLLPDGWEYEFAGVVVKNGEVSLAGTTIMSELDRKSLLNADGLQPAYSNDTVVIRGGMDGTFADDCNYDFDRDGLVNYQEYLVQSLRHLRYDDGETPLMGRYLMPNKTEKHGPFVPMQAWDGDAFYDVVKAAGYGASSAFKYRELGYFTLPPKSWDRLSFAGKGNAEQVGATSAPGYRIMLRPYAKLKTSTAKKEIRFEISSGSQGGKVYISDFCMYATTDPRQWDSDGDGMDDYYELFHGLNPLLGSNANPYGSDALGHPNIVTYDRIAMIYAQGTDLSDINAWCNAWTGWNKDSAPEFDAIKYPWMMGTAECDADGDSLRNAEEALLVNITAPSPSHTDPTPLWFTDSSNVDGASFTAQYYCMPVVPGATGSELRYYPWSWNINLIVYDPAMDGNNGSFMFAFEENEGYDTDRDGTGDAAEQARGVEPASDPLVYDDPDRRQALWLDGVKSAAVTYNGGFQRAFSSQYDLLRQFTVECWVKPEDYTRAQVILERVSDYGASTLSNHTAVIRANFRLGIDENGCFYGEYQGSTADSATPRVFDRKKRADNEWHHLALTFDGSVLSLYVDGGSAPVDRATDLGTIPANGITIMRQESGAIDSESVDVVGSAAVSDFGYQTIPCAFIVGAQALSTPALTLSANTTWDCFGSFYKGYIDEIRVWDGARTPVQISGAYKLRFSFQDVKDLRAKVDANGQKSGIYYEWLSGARRNNTSAKTLSPELIQHYNFKSLPGAVNAGDIMDEGLPTGFRAAVLDNVRKNGVSVDSMLACGWWRSAPVRSEVYTAAYVVPWIQNTCAHLPLMDGTTLDSQYWSENFAGINSAEDSHAAKFEFANSANPYPYYIYNLEKFYHLEKMKVLDADEISGNTLVYHSTNSHDYANGCLFQLRSDFVGTSDIVPLGNAFAKRGADFWDDQGAMDAWAATGKDADGNGIPDWAEALGYNTVEAYLRALAAGLLPDGTTDDKFKSTADVILDGVPDWWQKMYGVVGRALEDDDADGLANFMEYLIGVNGFSFADVSPLTPKSDTVRFDYFRKYGKLYLGEMFTDHDFMEDSLENEWSDIGANRTAYDAHLDANGNGWSNWADIRAKFAMGKVKREIPGSKQVDTTVVSSGYWDDTPLFTKYSEFLSYLDQLNATPDSVKVLDASWTPAISATPAESLDDPLGSGTIWLEVYSPKFGEYWKYKGYPEPEVYMNLYYSGVKQNFSEMNVCVRAYTSDAIVDPDFVNTIAMTEGETQRDGVWKFKLDVAARGSKHLREGKNKFEVWIDCNNDGLLTPGEPYGTAVAVDVGWSRAEFDVELLDTNPVFARIDVLTGENDRSLIWGTDSGNWTNVVAGTETGGEIMRVRVVRSLINGYDLSTASKLTDPEKVLLDKMMYVDNRSILTEADFLSETEFDLDWSSLSALINEGKNAYPDIFKNVSSVVYTIVMGSQKNGTVDNIVSSAITRKFDDEQAKPTAIAPGDDSSVVYASCPVFRWTLGSLNTYTAFRIQVLEADSANVVWDSGINRLPPKMDYEGVENVYSWKAPLYIGDQAPKSSGALTVLQDNANYKWRISVYNSKFKDDNWSDARVFRVNTYANPAMGSTYDINAKVKYYGAAEVSDDATKAGRIVRVEAFASPDFSGTPVGRAYVAEIVSLGNDDETVNATIKGVPAGEYYLRAFIDSDGDFKRSVWESWGYQNSLGDVTSEAIFAPKSVTVGAGITTPTAEIYIEDTDIDQDCLPDVYEYDAADGAENFLTKLGPADNEHNDYIRVNPELEESIRNLISAGASIYSFAPQGVASTFAAMMFGVDSVLPEVEADTLQITSLALEGDIVKLTVAAAAKDNSSLLAQSGMFVPVEGGKVTVTLAVKSASSLGGDWSEDTVEKTFEIEDGMVGDTLEFSLSELGLDSGKGFFKVELKR